MTIKGPPISGVTGMPPGERSGEYPDIESQRLVGGIETEGARLAWSRAADCPCSPVNSQTDQPNPNCELCRGLGVFYFGPTDYVPPAAVGELDEVQKAIIATDGAAVIRGVVARAGARADIYDQLGRWMWGDLFVSVRPENKLGYYDRLVGLDAEIPFPETVVVEEGSTSVPLRYLTTGVNLLRSLTTVYRQGVHFRLEAGRVMWLPGEEPSERTILTAHYLTHPTWRVIEHPHIIRETARRRGGGRRTTPHGTPTALPLQAQIKLEFLPVPGEQ